MTLSGWAQIAIVLVLVVGLAHPLGRFIAELFEGRRTFLSPVLAPVERGFYRLAGVDPAVEQGWRVYAIGAFMQYTCWLSPAVALSCSMRLIGVIIIVGLLTYFPALALGPIVEHFLMLGGKTF